jgi:hypothetical protein
MVFSGLGQIRVASKDELADRIRRIERCNEAPLAPNSFSDISRES